MLRRVEHEKSFIALQQSILQQLNFVFSDLDGNPLGCQCQLIRDLDIISYAVSSGTCSTPSKTSGVLLDSGSIGDPMYYSDIYVNTTDGTLLDSTAFQCSKYAYHMTLLSESMVAQW